MHDPVARAVREHLLAYLANQSTLRDLWVWLQADVVAPEVDRRNADVQALTGRILLYLAEYSAGHRTEQELRDLLLPVLTSYPAAGAVAVASTSARATPCRSYSVAA